MKSSTALQLTLMTGVAATLAFCSETQQSFSSAAECIDYGKPESLCRSAYEAALKEHAQSAPTFATIEECQAQVDVKQCVNVSRADSTGALKNVIVPMMAGYMIGQGDRKDERGDSGSAGGGGSYYYGGRYYNGTPLYQSRKDTGSYWTWSGPRNATLPTHHANLRTVTVSRGGFGGRSGFGGG